MNYNFGTLDSNAIAWQVKSIHDMLMKQLRGQGSERAPGFMFFICAPMVSTCTSPPNSHVTYGILCSALVERCQIE